jgi:hypothetical protein
MKHLLSPLSLGFAALTLVFTPLSHAANPKAKPTPTPARHTIISTISSDSVTINTGLTTKTFQVDKHTKFTFQGKLVAVNDLKQGMRVTVVPGFDGKTAESIDASDAPKAPAASPAASPAKK